MICAIIVISYYKYIICNAKNIWHITEYFHVFCIGSCHLLVLLQTGATHTYICQISMWMLLHMMIFLSSFRLWYPELASIIGIYLTLLNLGNISFNVGPLCIDLINTCLNCVGSKHNLTWPSALGASTELLHHYAVSSTPSGVIISILCNQSNSSLNAFCSAYATCLGGTWYGLLSGLSCNENVHSKHPMPLNTLSNSVCIFHVSSVLFLFSVSTIGHDRK